MKKISKIALVAISVVMLMCFVGCASTEVVELAPAPVEVPAETPAVAEAPVVEEAPAPAPEPAPEPEVVKVYPPFEAMYEVAGYRFVYKAVENTVTVYYIDVFSDAEIEYAANALAGELNATWTIPEVPGQVVLTLPEVPEKAVFDAFVETANAYIYDYFY